MVWVIARQKPPSEKRLTENSIKGPEAVLHSAAFVYEATINRPPIL